ncbi:MAG TPA: sigma-54-dependent Fis family transcriptional regulator [Pirellulaceae bacterium]|jgi:Nif-specific regulatory protein|nr:sigma-54-dependent Fis family transcriptional regulator [Pirellulaceae bacterium]
MTLPLSSAAASASVGPEWSDFLLRSLSPEAGGAEFAEKAIERLRTTAKVPQAGAFAFAKGVWRTLAKAGESERFPWETFADALDEGKPIVRREWLAAPLDVQSREGSIVVAIRFAAPPDAEALSRSLALCEKLEAAWRIERERRRLKSRIDRFEKTLGFLQSWIEAPDGAALLHRIAEAACTLLDCERASLFLRDRQTRELVGRPALGMANDELRIPEDAGIVGQVVRTGETRRVDADVEHEQAEIHRGPDQATGFQTRSILCVPLRDPGGEIVGAFEGINKRSGNFSDADEATLHDLARLAATALVNADVRSRLVAARQVVVDEAASSVQLIGQCAAIVALRSAIARLAETDLNVLTLGENGVGKEVVCRMLHYQSPRRNEPLIAVNCAALPDTLLESELFGHERGSFTDARETRQGKFEIASKGTIFLDEIGDMSLAGQSKLLRVLEERTIRRIGGAVDIPVDVRVIAATNQNLIQRVREKRFREDLFYRLNVATLDLPPLRDRGEDVILLAESFLAGFCRKAGRKRLVLSAGAKKRLLHHRWPGNVRELRNLMERLAFLHGDGTINEKDLSFATGLGVDEPSGIELDQGLTDATKAFQREYINRHIDASAGNMTEAADRLGLHRSNLYRKMRQLDMQTGDEKE